MLNQIKTKNRRMSCMKKMLKNKKGFSLVELVIVIAIMGVLAAVAISMFTGMIQRSRRRADDVRAQQIQKAVITYIAETGDGDLGEIGITDGDATEDLLTALQDSHSIKLPGSSAAETFGPYLENIKNEKKGENYFPQQDGSTGWDVTVNSETGDVQVELLTSGAGAVDILP
jgi:type IV pilus assembly protein PilA